MDELARRPRTLHVEQIDRAYVIAPRQQHRRSPTGISRLALLVHGYNNDLEQARENYQNTKRNLRQAGVNPSVYDNIWEFYWPGYVEGLAPRCHRRLSGSKRATESNLILSALSYGQIVPKAQAVGRALGDYLVELRGAEGEPAEVLLIAHSLGCRVVLEALRRFQDHGQQGRVPAVCLMAAAVQTDAFEQDCRFWRTVATADGSYVLYSRYDKVLRRWFRLGQTVAGEGWWPTAVGSSGEPNVWTARDEVFLDHGEYWNHPFTTRPMAKLFGLAVAHGLRDFRLLEWPLPADYLLLERDPPPEGRLEER